MPWNPYENLPPAASFSLTSTDLREGEKLAMPQVSGVFGAGGQDVSPQLSWSGFPAATKSFVVTMVDPEAPTVLGFWHWAVVNIPGDVTQLPTGAGDESGAGLPPGAFHLPNDARTKRYVGSAPPEGTGKHRYIFAALALDADKIEIDREATPAWLMYPSVGLHPWTGLPPGLVRAVGPAFGTSHRARFGDRVPQRRVPNVRTDRSGSRQHVVAYRITSRASDTSGRLGQQSTPRSARSD